MMHPKRIGRHRLLARRHGPAPISTRPLRVAAILAFTCGSVAACGGPSNATPDASGGASGGLWESIESARLVDLTHPLNDETLVWPTSAPFEFEVVFEGWTEEGYYYASRNFAGPEHGGTHLDAPVHFGEGRWTTTDIPLERLVGPAVVVDVSEPSLADPDFQVGVGELEAWEGEYGPIPPGALLFLFTDRSRLWPDPEAYLGTAEQGEAGVAALSFPGLAPEAARWLVENRSVAGVGIDTPSIDHGPSTLFETHRILAEANIFALENVAHLELLPPTGAVVFAFPMKLEGGTGGPVRIVALVED
jgi:kynurenine formamidase